MIFYEKDPTLKSFLMQEALAKRGFYTGKVDNWWGPRSEDALEAFQGSMASGVPLVKPMTVSAPAVASVGRQINADGIELIKHFEGLFLTAYLCPAGVWTIGYGHTGLKHKDGTVYEGRKISNQDAEDLLRSDLRKFELRVAALIEVPLNDNEFAALVSFDFNTGGLVDSTMRRMINAGDKRGAAEQFLRWNKVKGEVSAGLTRRRQSERNLYLGIKPFIVK